MLSVSKEPLKDKDVLCLGHLKRVFSLLKPLHQVGCQRDKAGNRELFFDGYVKIVLLYTWNPLISSIADLQQVLTLPKVSKALAMKRFSAGSFSESVRVFDPEQLKPVVEELTGQLTPSPKDPRLAQFKDAITLSDGTVIRGLARLAHSALGFDARYTTTRDGCAVYGSRLHLQLDLQRFTPHRMQRTGARNAGSQRESNVLRQNLEAGRCYVGDGGYADRSLYDQIVAAQSSYVIRAAENSSFTVVQDQPLSQEAIDAGVIRDAIVRFDETASPTHHPVRRIEIRVKPHPRRSRRNSMKKSDLIILYTSVMDLQAELIALIYQYRYTVELFFRILKQLLGLRHLLSQRQEGIDIQIYCALIVCVLIQLISGKKPNKAMRNMIGWYLLGLATEQDVVNLLNKPDNKGVKLRAKAELWKKILG
jgi:hypothetical protein